MWTYFKETYKSALLALCEEDSSVIHGFPTQKASNAENSFQVIMASKATLNDMCRNHQFQDKTKRNILNIKAPSNAEDWHLFLLSV